MTVPKKILASRMSEAEAIEGAKQGDGQCFQNLYARNKSRVYSLCLHMVGNIETAEDLTQEAFLQLHRKLATLRGDSTFHLWLQRLTVNMVLMHLRKTEPRMISLTETLETDEKTMAVQDQILAGAVDRVVLDRAIERLSRGCRVMFVLHDINGYDHNEIARLMGCSAGNSKSQLHRARMKLRDVLNVTRGVGLRRSVTQKKKTQPEVTIATGRMANAANAA